MKRCDHVRELAGRLCGHACRWYHGNWELLRSLGMVSTSAVHAAELDTLLSLGLRDCPDRPKLLLSGSTDDTLLRILLSAGGYRASDITALDVCATPLALMEEYSAERDVPLSCVHSDIFDYAPAVGFDLIVTHAFMGNFDAEGRSRLVRKWKSLLGDSGRLVTIQRVRPADAPAVVKFSPEQAAGFVRAAVLAATRVGDNRPELLARVETAANAFAANFTSYSITSRSELEGLFHRAGMPIAHLEFHTMPVDRGLSGPSVPSGGEYALIVAGRGVS